MKPLEYICFDLNFFTTTSGMILTAGVVVLLIALIVLLTSGKKKDSDKNEKIENNSDISNVEPVQQPDATQVQQTPIQNQVPIAPVATPSVIEPQVQPVQTFEQPTQPVVEPVPQVPIQNQVPITPVATPSVVEPQVQITENPVVEKQQVITEPIQPVETKPMTPVQPAPAVSIYGGVSPTANLFQQDNNQPKAIYGGADPLENTGAMPRVTVPVQSSEPIPQVEPVQTPIVQPEPVQPTQSPLFATPVPDIQPQPIVEPKVAQSTIQTEIPQAQPAPVQQIIPPKPIPKEELETLDF